MKNTACSGNGYKTAQKIERSLFTRMCIGEAIIELMQDKGMNGVNVSAIAKRSGVSRMTFYYLEEFLIIEKRFPRVRWILFSNELSEDFIRRMSIARNIGMILKENSGEEIHSALMCTAHGERFLCHQITNLLIIGSDKPEIHSVLTVTEIDILKLIAHGKSVKEIALERTSSIHTIITHKKNIFRKLGVNNVYEATKYTLRAGLIEMIEYYI